MNHDEFNLYFKFCTEVLDIKIYAVNTKQFNTVKIAISKKGVQIINEELYSQTPKNKEKKYWVVIAELYKEYYMLNHKK